MGAASSKTSTAASKAAAAVGRRQYPSSPSMLNSATSTSNAPSYQNQGSPRPTPSQSPLAPASNQAEPPTPSQVHPDPAVSPPTDTKTKHIELDGRDPQFANSLRKLGPAIAVNHENEGRARGKNTSTAPFPTSSQPPQAQQGRGNIFPSTSNASVMIVQARDRINQQFDDEQNNFGRSSFGGRTLLGAKDLKDVLRSLEEGRDAADIERRMRLKPGVLAQLGSKGVFENAQ